jgi:hypothetical protein
MTEIVGGVLSTTALENTLMDTVPVEWFPCGSVTVKVNESSPT